ncbi:TonB-dependent receptor [Bacteroides heparinolyticus]|uniref:TonB-dependent receptor n=1 Tax=Prevotella heparinolytica TaxID=28113 RepID=UPI0035A0816B
MKKNLFFAVSKVLFIMLMLSSAPCDVCAGLLPHTPAVEDETEMRQTFRVMQEDSREPIAGAVVYCDEAMEPRVTAVDGRCVIRFKTRLKSIKVRVSYVGFAPLEITVRADVSKTIDLFLREDIKQISEVTVVAQRKHTSVLQQTATIRQDALEKVGSASLAKLLETVPGVSSISTGNTIAKPVIQGMHSSRILLLNDGVRLESQSWGEDHAPEIDYSGANMIEVVKGAESIRYGYGAMGGVVLLNQAALPYGHRGLKAGGTVNMGYDSNARGYNGTATVEMGYKHVGLRLHSMYQKAGDYSTAEYILNNTGFNNISMSALAGYQNRNITMTLYTCLYYSRNGIYYASKVSDLDQLLARFEAGRPDESSFKPFSYDIRPPFQQVQHFTLKGDVKWDISKAHRLSLILSYQDNLRWEFENRKQEKYSWIPVQDLILSTYKTDVLWNAKWKRWDMTTEAGVSGTYQSNYNYPGTKQPAFIPNYAALTIGGFFLHQAKIGRLQCSLGMRYDFRAMDVDGYTSLKSYKYYKDFKVYSNFTSSLAAHYQFSDRWDARANIGWSWRPPDINELYATGLHHGSHWVVGNRSLTSEHGYKAVLGMRYHTERYSIEPSFFYQHVHNYIYDAIGKGANRFHNHPSGKYPRFIFGQDNVRLTGGDLTLAVTPLSGLTFTMKGEWIYARNLTKDEWLPFMPSDRYGMSGSYQWQFGHNGKYNASVSLSGIYVTKQHRYDPDKDLVPDSPPAYTLLNGTADWSMKLPGQRELKIVVIGDNILNALYKEYTDRFRYYAHARGSNVTFRTILKF